MTSRFGFAKSLEGEVKKARFTEQQIIEILKLAEAGSKVSDLCRQHGISQWTFYQWRNKYGGLGVNEVKRLKELEEENRRLKKIVADQALDVSALKEALHRKW
jgi:putative transposase